MPKHGYLLKARRERFNIKRGWFVNAWRIVNDEGIDMILPWFDTKSEARKVAKSTGIVLLGDYPPAITRVGD
jgi:hypothetical protein